MKRMSYKSQKAFTLVEVMVSLVLLFLVVMTFEIAFVNIIRSRQYNQSRRAALNVAKSDLERVRYDVMQGKYDEIGTIGGSPEGSRQQHRDNYTQFSGGRKFDVSTNIWWEEEKRETGITVYDAYKRIQVSVQEEKNDSYPTPPVTLNTLVADEAEYQTPEDNGVIIVNVEGTNIRHSNIPVSIAGPGGSKQGVTDNVGKLIFARLKNGNYLTSMHSVSGMMFKPIGLSEGENYEWQFDNNNKANVQMEGSSPRESVVFFIDFPGYLDIRLVDDYGMPVDFSSYSAGLELKLEFSIDGVGHEMVFDINNIADFGQLRDIGLWPGFIYNIIITNNETLQQYNMFNDVEANWDGHFNVEDSPEVIELDLCTGF